MRKPPMDDCGAKKAVSIPEEQIRPCRDRRNAAGQGAQVRRSLYVLRQRGGEPLKVHLLGLSAAGLNEYLMSFLIGKTFHFTWRYFL